MKKLTMFVFAFIFAGSVAFGQSNSSTVAQAGASHKAIVNQNSSFGAGHTVVGSQSGQLNFLDVLQDQANAEAYIEQSGNNNESRSKQSGYNIMEVLQEGNQNILGGYHNIYDRAYQKNGTGIFADDMNNLEVKQTGDLNKAGVWQEHYAKASINQLGNNNEAQVSQSGQPKGVLNEVRIVQNGDDNKADAYQRGEGNYIMTSASTLSKLNDVVVEQRGDDNISEFAIEYGDENVISETVDGDGNITRFTLTAHQGNMSSENKVNIQKMGNNNYVMGRISDDENQVDIVQNGNNNRIGDSWQFRNGVSIRGSFNDLDISQLSDNNLSINVVQGAYHKISVLQK